MVICQRKGKIFLKINFTSQKYYSSFKTTFIVIKPTPTVSFVEVLIDMNEVKSIILYDPHISPSSVDTSIYFKATFTYYFLELSIFLRNFLKNVRIGEP